MTEHTKEPWQFKEQGDADEYCLLTADGLRWVIAFRINGSMMPDMQRANCKRIVACVNACAGISTEVLELSASGTAPTLKEIFNEYGSGHKAEQQRDELLAALKDCLAYNDAAAGEFSWAAKARAAIAKAEGSE